MTGGARWSPAWPRNASAAYVARHPGSLVSIGREAGVVACDGRNSYGMRLAELSPIVRGSSCTATPPDEIARADAARWQQALHAQITAAACLPSHRDVRGPIVDRIVQAF